MFAELPEAPIDPILGMAQAFASDPSPNKVDLGIGIYKDERGEVIVLPTVKAAERALHEGQMTKRYLGLKITETGSQNVNVCVVAIGMEGIHKPDNANNDASVVNQNVCCMKAP